MEFNQCSPPVSFCLYLSHTQAELNYILRPQIYSQTVVSLSVFSLQVCLQLWEFPTNNDRLFTGMFIATEFQPSSSTPSIFILLIFNLTFRLRVVTSRLFRNHGFGKSSSHSVTNHNILLPLCLLTALLPVFLPVYVHLSGKSFRPLVHQQRPHIKHSFGRLGSDIIAAQVFV